MAEEPKEPQLQKLKKLFLCQGEGNPLSREVLRRE